MFSSPIHTLFEVYQAISEDTTHAASPRNQILHERTRRNESEGTLGMTRPFTPNALRGEGQSAARKQMQA